MNKQKDLTAEFKASTTERLQEMIRIQRQIDRLPGEGNSVQAIRKAIDLKYRETLADNRRVDACAQACINTTENPTPDEQSPSPSTPADSTTPELPSVPEPPPPPPSTWLDESSSGEGIEIDEKYASSWRNYLI